MQAVHALQNDTYRHLNDGEDNCELHLEVIGERQQLVTAEPHWVETHRVDMRRVVGRIGIEIPCIAVTACVVDYLNFILVVRAAEDTHGNCKELVID